MKKTDFFKPFIDRIVIENKNRRELAFNAKNVLYESRDVQKYAS